MSIKENIEIVEKYVLRCDVENEYYLIPNDSPATLITHF